MLAKILNVCLISAQDCDFSYSGLKTAMLRKVKKVCPFSGFVDRMK
jgi:tRNA A37 threonylcarbamoyltransferase TsaD